jgi:hypothetical protein
MEEVKNPKAPIVLSKKRAYVPISVRDGDSPITGGIKKYPGPPGGAEASSKTKDNLLNFFLTSSRKAIKTEKQLHGLAEVSSGDA